MVTALRIAGFAGLATGTGSLKKIIIPPPLVLADQGAHRGVVVAQHAHHLPGALDGDAPVLRLDHGVALPLQDPGRAGRDARGPRGQVARMAALVEATRALSGAPATSPGSATTPR
jgi:hypothetical protein